ncbi:hypothetical protein Agabi119p4_2173 [Agaricus bisporus var. burnettii]|uniref:Initiator tRNA phosphoribosyl transferase n=1 Tax=Agaricus bisporus var. burnettii TaxID=192524 RepID=A0A8H7F8P5_AGABI|nr:hypothetical protein Agabi119p4_2173 [Agaricus bisporus var. burnettii]
MIYDDTFDGIKQASHNALTTLRKESLDIYNRLHSIEEDITFVNYIQNHYSNLPLLPNLRCGAWYTDPALAVDTPAYFKSTDGHTGNWGFNLRRANLHLLPLISERHGLLLVDSTRAGKRMPDALSKTVPIWCAVVNRAILIRRQRQEENNRSVEWDIQLYTPPSVVSAQEHDQIGQRLKDWARALADSSFELPLDLPAPLRPFWITPSMSSLPNFRTASASPAFLPVVCVSASKQIETGAERRTSGFVYVQGSGDDHELWGMGLTPQAFWKHRKELISAQRIDLEGLIKQIVSSSSSINSTPSSFSKLVSPPTPIKRINGRICLSSFEPSNLPALLISLKSKVLQDPRVAYILLDFLPSSTTNLPTATLPNILHIHASPKSKSKPDAYFSSHILPTAIPFIHSHLSLHPSNTINIIEGCNNDPGSRLDISAGIVVTAIQLFFNEHGDWSAAVGNGSNSNSSEKTQIDKKSIRKRLEWIVESEPRVNPSRATLKRVNEYLLTPMVYFVAVKPS